MYKSLYINTKKHTHTEVNTSVTTYTGESKNLNTLLLHKVL